MKKICRYCHVRKTWLRGLCYGCHKNMKIRREHALPPGKPGRAVGVGANDMTEAELDAQMAERSATMPSGPRTGGRV